MTADSRSNNNNNINQDVNGQSSERGSCKCNEGFESITDKNGGTQCVGYVLSFLKKTHFQSFQESTETTSSTSFSRG